MFEYRNFSRKHEDTFINIIFLDLSPHNFFFCHPLEVEPFAILLRPFRVLYGTACGPWRLGVLWDFHPLKHPMIPARLELAYPMDIGSRSFLNQSKINRKDERLTNFEVQLESGKLGYSGGLCFFVALHSNLFRFNFFILIYKSKYQE